MEDLSSKIALISALRTAVQRLAWRFHLPAIVLPAAAGTTARTIFDLLDISQVEVKQS